MPLGEEVLGVGSEEVGEACRAPPAPTHPRDPAQTARFPRCRCGRSHQHSRPWRPEAHGLPHVATEYCRWTLSIPPHVCIKSTLTSKAKEDENTSQILLLYQLHVEMTVFGVY